MLGVIGYRALCLRAATIVVALLTLQACVSAYPIAGFDQPSCIEDHCLEPGQPSRQNEESRDSEPELESTSVASSPGLVTPLPGNKILKSIQGFSNSVDTLGASLIDRAASGIRQVERRLRQLKARPTHYPVDE